MREIHWLPDSFSFAWWHFLFFSLFMIRFFLLLEVIMIRKRSTNFLTLNEYWRKDICIVDFFSLCTASRLALFFQIRLAKSLFNCRSSLCVCVLSSRSFFLSKSPTYRQFTVCISRDIDVYLIQWQTELDDDEDLLLGVLCFLDLMRIQYVLAGQILYILEHKNNNNDNITKGDLKIEKKVIRRIKRDVDICRKEKQKKFSD